MIVDPDFLDHWRTGMVSDALGDPMAPVYILRLWAHCQERKSDTFILPTRGLKSQCKFPGDADAFEAALIDAGFLARVGDTVTVTGWAEKNASLLAAWSNGGKGGRPKKNPKETHGKPTGNPGITQIEPIANPDETDKRREEKRREEQPTEAKASGAKAPVPERRDEPQNPKDTVFALGIPLLTAAGVRESNARSFLAMQCKGGRDADVAKALEDCAVEKPIQPIPWLQTRLNPSATKTGKHSGFASKDYRDGVTEDGTFA